MLCESIVFLRFLLKTKMYILMFLIFLYKKTKKIIISDFYQLLYKVMKNKLKKPP